MCEQEVINQAKSSINSWEARLKRSGERDPG